MKTQLQPLKQVKTIKIQSNTITKTIKNKQLKQ